MCGACVPDSRANVVVLVCGISDGGCVSSVCERVTCVVTQLSSIRACPVSIMINGWIRDDLNLWQHLSQYSEVTEQSEYLTQYHRLHTFCLIVVLLNSCLKTVAQLFMFSTTPGCL